MELIIVPGWVVLDRPLVQGSLSSLINGPWSQSGGPGEIEKMGKMQQIDQGRTTQDKVSDNYIG